MEKRVTLVENSAKTNASAIEDLNAKYDEVSNKVDSITVSENGGADSEDIFEELRDREARRTNIIIYSLPEAASSVKELAARKKEDTVRLEKVFETIKVPLDVKSDIRFISRPGKISDDPVNEPRPLILGLKTTTQQEKVMGNAHFLADTEYDFISIVPDLTQRQRNDEKKMKEEAEKRNKARTGDDLNWEWRMVGPRGKKRLIRAKLNVEGGPSQQRGGRKRRAPMDLEASQSQPREKRPSISQ